MHRVLASLAAGTVVLLGLTLAPAADDRVHMTPVQPRAEDPTQIDQVRPPRAIRPHARRNGVYPQVYGRGPARQDTPDSDLVDSSGFSWYQPTPSDVLAYRRQIYIIPETVTNPDKGCRFSGSSGDAATRAIPYCFGRQ